MPDFGIFRGFNDKLFGNKLYAGQLPTQLGLIGSLDFGFDADAQAFFDRVTTAGGSLSNTEKTAVNQLVLDMKSYSIWSKMKAIYPMVGASAAACAQNLKSSSFTGTFSSGWTFASTGVTPNGSSAYFDTTFNNQGDWTSTSNGSMGFVSRTNPTAGTQCDMGSGTILSGANSSTIYSRYSGDVFYSALNGTTVVPGDSNTSSIGFFCYITTFVNRIHTIQAWKFYH